MFYGSDFTVAVKKELFESNLEQFVQAFGVGGDYLLDVVLIHTIREIYDIINTEMFYESMDELDKALSNKVVLSEETRKDLKAFFDNGYYIAEVCVGAYEILSVALDIKDKPTFFTPGKGIIMIRGRLED